MENIEVKITIPENVSDVIRQKKINTLYDILSSVSKNAENKKVG